MASTIASAAEARVVRRPQLTSSDERKRSVLTVVELEAFALREDVSLERPQLRIVGIECFALDRVLDAPVDHVAQQGDLL